MDRGIVEFGQSQDGLSKGESFYEPLMLFDFVYDANETPVQGDVVNEMIAQELETLGVPASRLLEFESEYDVMAGDDAHDRLKRVEVFFPPFLFEEYLDDGRKVSDVLPDGTSSFSDLDDEQKEEVCEQFNVEDVKEIDTHTFVPTYGLGNHIGDAVRFWSDFPFSSRFDFLQVLRQISNYQNGIDYGEKHEMFDKVALTFGIEENKLLEDVSAGDLTQDIEEYDWSLFQQNEYKDLIPQALHAVVRTDRGRGGAHTIANNESISYLDGLLEDVFGFSTVTQRKYRRRFLDEFCVRCDSLPKVAPMDIINDDDDALVYNIAELAKFMSGDISEMMELFLSGEFEGTTKLLYKEVLEAVEWMDSHGVLTDETLIQFQEFDNADWEDLGYTLSKETVTDKEDIPSEELRRREVAKKEAEEQMAEIDKMVPVSEVKSES